MTHTHDDQKPVPFTEEPWIRGRFTPCTIETPDGQIICEAEHPADASLIAQAPEMFELLEDLDRPSHLRSMDWDARWDAVKREVRGE